MLLFMLLIIQPVHLEFVFPTLTKQWGCSQGSQILGVRDSSDLGCQDLSKHLRILMLSSSLLKIFLRQMIWFTMWVNLFCTSAMVSHLSIQNISYSWIRECFLTPFTSVVPSCVTSRIYHISFVEEHCETLKNSSEFRAGVMMFLAIQSNWALLLSVSVHWDQGFSIETSFFQTLE